MVEKVAMVIDIHEPEFYRSRPTVFHIGQTKVLELRIHTMQVTTAQVNAAWVTQTWV